MEGTANARMQQRRGTSEEWASLDPILLAGEFGFETDTGVVKIGDGVKKWSELEHVGKGAFVFDSEGEEGGGTGGGSSIDLPPSDGKYYLMKDGEWEAASVLLTDPKPSAPSVIVATPKMRFVKATPAAPNAHSTAFQCIKCFEMFGVKQFLLFGEGGRIFRSDNVDTWVVSSGYTRSGAYVTDAVGIQISSSRFYTYESHSASSSTNIMSRYVNTTYTNTMSTDALKNTGGSSLSRPTTGFVVANDRYVLLCEQPGLNGAAIFDTQGNTPTRISNIISFTAGNKPVGSACWSPALGKFLVLDPTLSQALLIDGEPPFAVQTGDIITTLMLPVWVPTSSVFMAFEQATAKPWISNDGLTWLPASTNLSGDEFTDLTSVRPTWIPELGLLMLCGKGREHSVWATKDLNYWFPLPLPEENVNICSLAFNGDTGRMVVMPYVSTGTDNSLYFMDL